MKPIRFNIIPGDSVELERKLNYLTRWIAAQPLLITSTPTFAGLTITGLSGVLKATAGVISGSATFDNVANGTSTTMRTNLNADLLDGQHAADFEPSVTKYDLAGTTNQITLSASGIGTLFGRDITLSLPQDIATTSSPTFNTLIISTGTPTTFSTRKGADSDGYNLWLGNGGASAIGDPYNNSLGSYNISIGLNALLANTTGMRNIAIGRNVLVSNLDGYNNFAMGWDTLYSNTSGYNNIAVGVDALYFNTTGNNNSSMGLLALYGNTTGSYNVGVGQSSGLNNQSGSYNIFLGYYAGAYETSSNAFYVDNQNRTNTVGDKTKALLYGVFAAAPANQSLTINAGTVTLYNHTGLLKGTSGVVSTADNEKFNLTTRQLAVYNGFDSLVYRIGIAESKDGYSFVKSSTNPILSPTVAAWDDGHVKDPFLVKVLDTYYLYYTGWKTWFAGVSQIGLATSKDGLTWTKETNPVVTFTGSTHRFPVIVYDSDDTDATQRWKMWFTDDNYDIGYAYSSDGYTWTKYTSNPVLSRGAAATWDDNAICPGCIYKSGTTWYLYYQGFSSTEWAMGLATFTNPKSTYTKNGGNPLLSGRSSAGASLTSDILTGSKTIDVADTSVFEVNEPVLLYDDNTSYQVNRVFSIDSATQLTLRDAATGDYTTAQNAVIRSVYYHSVIPRSIAVEDSQYIIYGTAFEALSDKSVVNEMSVVFKSSSLDSGWEIDIDRGVLMPLGSWDTVSAENPCVISSYDTFHLNLLQQLKPNYLNQALLTTSTPTFASLRIPNTGGIGVDSDLIQMWYGNIKLNTALGIGINPTVPLHASKEDASTNSVLTVAMLDRYTTGTPAAGIGVQETWRVEGTGGIADAAAFQAYLNDGVNNSSFNIQTFNAGVPVNCISMDNTGKVTIAAALTLNSGWTGLLKATAGVVSVAAAGTDFDNYWTRTGVDLTPKTVGDTITSTATITGEQLTSTDDITMAGYFLNTSAATDISNFVMNGDSTPYNTADPSAIAIMNYFNKTITGSAADADKFPATLQFFTRKLTWDFDYSDSASLLTGKYIATGGDSLLFSGDIYFDVGISAGANNYFYGNFSTSQFSGLYTSNKNWSGSWVGGFFNAVNTGTYNITGSTNTLNFIGGKFSTTGASPTVSVGTPVFNYYGGYFEGIGTAGGTSTTYGGYFSGTGGDINYDVFTANPASLNILAGTNGLGNTRVGWKTITGSIDPAASTAVVGVGTLFTTEVAVGDLLLVTGEMRRVVSIGDNTNLVVDVAFSNNANDTSPEILTAPTVPLDVTGAILSSTTIEATTGFKCGGTAAVADATYPVYNDGVTSGQVTSITFKGGICTSISTIP